MTALSVSAPLSQRLALETRVHAPDGGGGLRDSWIGLGVHYAAIQPVSGAETRVGSQQAQRVTHRVTIRSAPYGAGARPRADQRFRAGARVFDIKAVFEGDLRGSRLTCLCEESLLSEQP